SGEPSFPFRPYASAGFVSAPHRRRPSDGRRTSEIHPPRQTALATRSATPSPCLSVTANHRARTQAGEEEAGLAPVAFSVTPPPRGGPAVGRHRSPVEHPRDVGGGNPGLVEHSLDAGEKAA